MNFLQLFEKNQKAHNLFIMNNIKKIILTVISMSALFFVYKLFLKHSFKELPTNPSANIKNKTKVLDSKPDRSGTNSIGVQTEAKSEEVIKVYGEDKSESLVQNQNQNQNVNESLQDPEYSELLENGEFQEAMKHILAKSEEHISGNPSREDFTQKLEVMHRYVKHNPEILKRDFGFFVGYYTLNAFEKKDEEVSSLDPLIEDFYVQQIADSSFCIKFFKEVARKEVDYSSLSKVVFDCAANPKKRSIVHDYVNFLKQNKNENHAMEEYMKLRLLYNDLPEYGTYHHSL